MQFYDSQNVIQNKQKTCISVLIKTMVFVTTFSLVQRLRMMSKEKSSVLIILHFFLSTICSRRLFGC